MCRVGSRGTSSLENKSPIFYPSVMEHRGACSVCKSLGEREWGKKRGADFVFGGLHQPGQCENMD
jgi:hypothetical protein